MAVIYARVIKRALALSASSVALTRQNHLFTSHLTFWASTPPCQRCLFCAFQLDHDESSVCIEISVLLYQRNACFLWTLICTEFSASHGPARVCVTSWKKFGSKKTFPGRRQRDTKRIQSWKCPID
jgi:hypothetical protein